MILPDTIRIRRVGLGVDYPLPARLTAGASGLDLRAAAVGQRVLDPMGRILIPTGIALELPRGLEAQVRPRSGLAVKFGLTVTNAPGTIDSDYRGEIHVSLINLGSEVVVIEPGDRIAQLIIAPVWMGSLVEADTLTDTERGSGGFGSTGK